MKNPTPKKKRTSVKNIQMAFWTMLKKSNPELFAGTPHRAQYYHLVHPELGKLKIRLDIYLKENDYKKQGYLVVSLVFANNLLTRVAKSLNYSQDCDVVVNQPFILRNFNADCFVEDEKNWPNAEKWFRQSVSKILKALATKR